MTAHIVRISLLANAKRIPRSVSDGVLSLQREEEARGEVVDARHTGDVAVIGAIHGVEIAVLQQGEIPHAGEQQPRRVEGRREEDKDPLPAEVEEGDEEVLEELVGAAVGGAQGVHLKI